MNASPSRHPVWAVADVVVVLALVALAVVGLQSTFVDWGFLVVAEIAAAGAVLVVLATLRLPVIALVAAGPFAGILLAGPWRCARTASGVVYLTRRRWRT